MEEQVRISNGFHGDLIATRSPSSQCEQVLETKYKPEKPAKLEKQVGGLML